MAHAGPQRRGIVWKHFVASESVPLRAENNAQTTSEQLKTNYQKPLKTGFLTLKIVKMTLSEGKNLAYYLDFRGQISTFQAENTQKSKSLEAKNDA